MVKLHRKTIEASIYGNIQQWNLIGCYMLHSEFKSLHVINISSVFSYSFILFVVLIFN